MEFYPARRSLCLTFSQAIDIIIDRRENWNTIDAVFSLFYLFAPRMSSRRLKLRKGSVVKASSQESNFRLRPSEKIHSRLPTLPAPPRSCPTVSARKSGYPASDQSSGSWSRRSRRTRARAAGRATTAAASLSWSGRNIVDEMPEELVRRRQSRAETEKNAVYIILSLYTRRKKFDRINKLSMNEPSAFRTEQNFWFSRTKFS